MTFLEHLEELRRRLLRCAIAVVGGMIICWFFREEFRAFLEAPLYEAWSQVEGLPPPKPLHFAGLIEPFVAYLKLSAVGGVFIASPVILYQLWRFVSPGLYPRERKVAAPFVIVSTLLFVGGSAMAYTMVFPIGFRFFLEFAAGREVETLEASVSTALVAPAAEPIRDAGPAPPKAAVGPPPAEPPPEKTTEGEPHALVALDGGVDAGVLDAGTEDGRDAGPDTGLADTVVEVSLDGGVLTVETRERPTPTTPQPVAEQRDAGVADEGRSDAGPGEPGVEGVQRSWYEWVLHKILRSSCRELEVEATEGRVALTVDWDEEECGPPPTIVGLSRNDGDDDIELEVEWREDREARPGHVVFEAFDRPPSVGEHAYEVRLTPGGGIAGEGQLSPILMVQDYLSFAVRLLLAFGLVFELPILISFLAFAGIVNYKQLLRFSRWFIVLAFVFAAVLTPPDVITQILLAAPLIVLYFASVVVAYIVGERPGPGET